MSSEDIQVHVRPDLDLSGALVIVGAPGIGFVGAITTRYLVEQLEMTRIGGLHSSAFPPYAPVEEGRPLHPVRVHHLQTQCGLDLSCEQVVVVTSEFVAGPTLVHPLATALLDWAEGLGAEAIVVPDAVVGEEGKTEEDRTVRGIGATETALAFLDRAGVPRLEQGLMMGLTAGLLSESERRGIDTMAVVCESAPDHPDARGAAALVGFLDRLLPGVRIESGPLVRRAEEIEATVRTIRAQMAQQGQGVPTERDQVSMFH